MLLANKDITILRLSYTEFVILSVIGSVEIQYNYLESANWALYIQSST